MHRAVHADWPPTPKRVRPWTRDGLRRADDHAIFRVERHAMRDPAGQPRRDVTTIACPDWVNVLAITPAHELVLVWQYRFGSERVALEIPGGVIDRGESAAHAASRELREETGYGGAPPELVAVVEPNPAIQGNRCHTFLVRAAELRHTPDFDDLEDLETCLVPLAQVSRLIDEGIVTHALAVVALEALIRRGLA